MPSYNNPCLLGDTRNHEQPIVSYPHFSTKPSSFHFTLDVLINRLFRQPNLTCQPPPLIILIQPFPSCLLDDKFNIWRVLKENERFFINQKKDHSLLSHWHLIGHSIGWRERPIWVDPTIVDIGLLIHVNIC